MEFNTDGGCFEHASQFMKAFSVSGPYRDIPDAAFWQAGTIGRW